MSYGYIDDMYQLHYANDTESITVATYNSETSIPWTSNNYKYVDLGSTAQEVSDDFYNWFTENTNVAYTVSTKLTNLTASSITPMIVGDTQTITLTASTNYNIPAQSAITITGATITNYTKTSNTVCKITVGSVTGNITITASGVEQTAAPQNVQITDTELTWNSVADITGLAEGYNATYDVYVDGTLFSSTDGADGYSITVNNTSHGSWDDVKIYASDTNPVATESYNLVRVFAENFKTSRQYVRFTTGTITNFLSTSGGVTKISGTVDDFTFKVTGDGIITVETDE